MSVGVEELYRFEPVFLYEFYKSVLLVAVLNSRIYNNALISLIVQDVAALAQIVEIKRLYLYHVFNFCPICKNTDL